MSEFLPLRTKLKRAGTGEEDNFVPSYLPETLAAARDSREDFEKVQCTVRVHVTTSAYMHMQPASTNYMYNCLL